MRCIPPTPLARATLPFQAWMETTSDKCAARTRKQGPLHRECTSPQVIPQTPPPQGQEGENGWQDTNQYPTNTIPSPKPQKTFDIHRPTEKRTAKFHSSQSCKNNTYCCSDKGVALAKEGGGGYVAYLSKCVMVNTPQHSNRCSGDPSCEKCVAQPDSNAVCFATCFCSLRLVVGLCWGGAVS